MNTIITKRFSLFLLVSLAIINLTCSTEDSQELEDRNEEMSDSLNEENESSEITSVGLPTTKISFSIKTPEGSTFPLKDLSVYTFAEKLLNPEINQNIDIFESDDYELVYVENPQGKIIFMGYHNPSLGDSLVLNSESTAIALVLSHPWAMNFTSSLKTELLDFIRENLSFKEFLIQVENAIISQNLDNLNVDNTVAEIVQSLTGDESSDIDDKTEVFFEENPIKLNISSGIISVTNSKNIHSYSLRLFDENGQPESQAFILSGVDYEITSISRLVDFFKGNPFPDESELQLNVPEDGIWTIKLNTGFADNTTNDLRHRISNVTSLMINLIGLVSPTLAKTLKNGECLNQIGSFLGESVDMLIQDFVINDNHTQLSKKLFGLFSNLGKDVVDITLACSDISLDDRTFGKIFRRFAQIDRYENAGLFAIGLSQIGLFENKAEFCFTKSSNEVFYCDGLTLEGDLSFGEVSVNQTLSKTFEIINTLQVPVNIIDIELPNGFTMDNETPVIPANSSIPININFTPVSEDTYSGDLVVNSDAIVEDLVLPISGIGIIDGDNNDENIPNLRGFLTGVFKFSGGNTNSMCNPLDETGRFDNSVFWRFKQGGSIEIVDRLGNPMVGLASQEGSYQYTNGVLSFNLSYTIITTRTCRFEGQDLNYSTSFTFSSTFVSNSKENEPFSFYGDFTYDTIYSYSGAIENCNVDQSPNNYCEGSRISIGCILDCD